MKNFVTGFAGGSCRRLHRWSGRPLCFREWRRRPDLDARSELITESSKQVANDHLHGRSNLGREVDGVDAATLPRGTRTRGRTSTTSRSKRRTE